MAANRVTLTITLDAQQAQDQIKRLKDLSDQLKDSLKNVQERMADRTKWLPGDTEKTLSKQENALKKQIKELNKQIKDGEYMLDGVEERLKKMADYSYTNLKKLENVVKNALKNAQFNTDSYRKAAEWLQKVNDEMAKRRMDINNQETVADAKKVLKKPGNYSMAEIQNAIKTLTELQAITKHNKKEWDRLEESIQRGKDQLKAWTDAAKEAKANDRQANLTSLSTDALSEQKKYWQSMVDGAEQGSAALANYQGLLKQVVDEEQHRATIQAESVMKAKQNYSVKEIEDAIKLTEQLRDAEKYRSAEWIKYTNQIKEATDYLKTYESVAKMAEMEKQWHNLTTLSKTALDEQKKYWQELSDNEGDPQKLKTYLGMLEQVNKELERRNILRADAVMSDLDNSSVKEIQDAIKLTEQLRDAQKQGSPEWIKFNSQIEVAKKHIQDFQNSLRESKMADQFQQLATLSAKALDEQQKYWKEMADNEGDPTKLQTYLGYLKAVNSELNQRNKVQAESVLKAKQNYSVKEIEDAIKLTEQLRDAEKYRSAEWIKYTNQIKEATDYLKTYESVAKMAEMEKQWHNLTTLSKTALDEQKKYWQELSDNEGDPQKLKTYLGMLEQVNKELERRNILRADAVMSDLDNSSVKEIQDAIKLTEQLRDAQKAGSAEWEYFNLQIQDATAHLRKYEEAMKRTAMNDQFKQLMQLSQKALEEQRKYWQEEMRNAANNDPMLKTYTANLKAVNKELERRTELQTSDVLKNPSNYSVKEVEDAIKATEQLRDAQSRGSVQWHIYNQQIENARKYLNDYAELAKRSQMEVQMLNVAKLSQKALEEQKKFWQEVVAGTEATDPLMQRYVDLLKKANDEMNRRDEGNAMDVMNSLSSRSNKEIEDAIKIMQRLRDEQPFNNTLWKQYNTEIERAQKQLKTYEEQLKQTAMTARIANVTDASTASLEEQKKYWQTMIDGAEQSNTQLPQYIANLQRINDEEERRAKNSAQDIISRVNSGWDDTIKNTEEAVKQLKEYRKQLNTTDTAGLKQVDDAIDILNGKIAQSVEGYMSLQDALNNSSESAMQNYRGTIEELEKLKKALETLRKTAVSANDAQKLDEIDSSLARVNIKIAEANGNIRDFDDFIKNIDKKSFAELQAAASQLSEQLKHAAANSDEFVTQSAQLREVNARIKEVKKEWENHDNVLMRTAKRLASYVAVYAGFNEIKSKVSQLVGLNLELSDSMADVQKTTGLWGVDLQELGKSINAIDTRTLTNDLWGMAAAAGQIGLKTQDDVLGFVKAANMINVSLNELGAEGSATLMKIADLTGDKALYGVEGSLLKVGSAINELTANTAATAGPIADFIGRVGGIASVSSITIDQMAAIGATSDATAQSVEIAGTSMNKLVNALTSNTANIAYAANVSRTELEGLIKQGKTMEAMIRVFEAMDGMDSAKTLNVLKELGSEGARMNQFVTTLVANLDLLQSNLDIASKAFEQATSIENEYNVKNESAIGVLQRMKNSFIDTFVNSRFVEILKDILLTIQDIPRWLEKNRLALFALKLVIYEIIAFNIPAILHTIMVNLSGMYKLISGSLVAGVGQLKKAWDAAVISLNIAGVATNGLTGKIRVLWAIIKANPIGLLMTAVVAMYAVWDTWFNKVDKIAKATAELSEKQSRERMELNAMKNALNDENTSRERKRKIISDLNGLYGKYLDFELEEIDLLNKKGSALDYINTKLKEQQALEMKNKQQDVIDEDYQADTRDYISRMQDVLSNVPEITRKRWAEAFDFINQQIEDGVTDGEQLIERLKKRFNIEGNLLSTFSNIKEYLLDNMAKNVGGGAEGALELFGVGDLYETFAEQMTSYAKLYKQHKEDLLNIENDYQWQMKKYTAEEVENLRKLAAEQTAQMTQEYKSNEEVNAMEETEQRKYYKRMLQLRENYGKVLQKLSEATKGNEKQRWNIQIELNDKQVELYKGLMNPDAYGKNNNITDWTQFAKMIENLDTSSVDALVSGYKKLTEESAQITANVDLFNKMFNMNVKPGDFAAMEKQVYDWATQIRNELKKRNRGVTGEFLFGSDGTEREAKRKAKEEYQAALSAFEAYWNERETVLRQKSAEQLDTEAELNRKLERMNEEKWADQVQLYMKLLDDFYRQSTFDGSKYVGPLTNLDYFKDKDLDQLRVQLDKWGIAMEDGMKQKMTEVGVKLQVQLHKVCQEIEKLLLDNNFTEQVINQYLEAIDRLGLLYNVNTEGELKRSREQSRLRLAVMRQFADESYNLDAAALRKRMEQQEIFAEWSKGRTDEEYEALLQMLRKYHDDAAEADRKAAERRKKIFDNSTQGVALEDAGKKLEEESGTEQEKWKRFEELDLVTGDVSRDVEIDLYKQKIDLSAQYIDSIKKEMEVEKLKAKQAVVNAEAELEARRTMGKDTADAEAALAAARQQYASLERQEMLMTQDARQKMMENTQHLNDLYMQSEQSKLTEMKKYTDAVVEFSGQMGEAAFGEVEDRKEAAKQLVKTLLTSLKDWAAVKLTELAMKRMFAAQSTAIEGQQVVSDLTMTGAKTAADIAAGGASATAKETGKLGFAGLAVGAVISAALGALLGLAMSALNKSKSTVQSVSGAGGGKLATGMLTFGRGNYPVLGNDGNVYNAKYEGSNPQTGIYGGGAHFGIFSEKKPEAIIDGDTTHKLVTDYRGLWNAILTISRYGSLPSKGMPTFATGNIDQLAAAAAQAGQSATLPTAEQQQLTQATLAALTQTMQRTNAVMEYLAANGVGINMYSDKGLYKQSKKASKFAERVGL